VSLLRSQGLIFRQTSGHQLLVNGSDGISVLTPEAEGPVPVSNLQPVPLVIEDDGVQTFGKAIA
jgi:hypothetical protein